MRGLAFLLLLLTALMLVPSTARGAEMGCDASERLTTGCPSVSGSLTDDEAVLNGTAPGSGAGSTTVTGGPPPATPRGCVATATETCRPMFTVVAAPTLNDLIGFRPTPAVDHMQPNGWFVVGLDANFYATGGSSVQTGPLLGYPAQVRFTPIRWSWTYGDGHSATRSTPGTTWAAQGIEEFDPTPTSHVYDQPGTYYIDLTVGYRAEYNYDNTGWEPIVGVLWVPANQLVATVGSAKTVLVERDCAGANTGPGC